MAKLEYKNGVTSVIARFKLEDSTTGAAKTGLTFASSGLIISTIADNEATPTAYTVAGSNVETITTLGTFAAPTAGKCRFREVDATNHPGLYEVQISNTRWAVSNARSIIITISGASGTAQADAEYQLSADDPFVAKPTNFNIAAIDSNGRVDVIKVAGTTQTARDLGGTLGAAGAGLTALGDARIANLDAAVSTRSTYSGGAVASVTGSVGSVTAGVTLADGAITAAKIGTDAITAAKIAADAVTKIQTGLATSVAVAQLQSDIEAGVPSLVTGYATDQSPADYVLASPSRKLATDVSGRVSLNLAQAVDTGAWASVTVADILKGDWADALGKVVLDLPAKKMYLYAPDNATVLRTFNLDSETAPTTRTPV